MPSMTKLGARLVLARESKGDLWTRKHLAVASGVSYSTISMLEQGSRGNTGTVPGTIPQIAKALGVYYEWLAYGTGPMIIVGDQSTAGQGEVSINQAELSSLQIATIDGLTRALKNGDFSDKDCVELLQRLVQ